MNSDFLIVAKKILPGYFDQVIYARRLLENHEAETITEAVKKAGISRNTYYKYKDYVFAITDASAQHKIVLSMTLKDEAGALTAVLQTLSKYQTSILTISQAIPISGSANVLISLDITKMSISTNTLIQKLVSHKCVYNVHLDAVS